MSDGRKKLSAFEQLKSLVKGKKSTTQTEKNTNKHQVKSDATNRTDRKPNAKRLSQQRTHSGSYNQQMRTPQFGQKMGRQQQTSQPSVSKDATVTVAVNLQDQMEVESRRLFGWLCRNFPGCFNPKAKKPLKVGINDDIVTAFLARTQRQIHFGVLTRVLRRYVGDQAYQRAILEHKQRFNLEGEAVEDISDEHLEHAQVRLEELQEKARLRAQGIDPRTVMAKKEEQATDALEQVEPLIEESTQIDEVNLESDVVEESENELEITKQKDTDSNE
ncbi:ProQ/FinO family protein [Thiotrichales bacterium 19S3-7]|nr:ProQ/FinO family protein [Thiotrichales bacterium 19S3-7]MCF6801975.1 ProQ/FinO family protein [Thiotrichales bacterium 19S3-11]